MTEEQPTMLWELDYPRSDQILYGNLNVASGWCLHASEPVRSVTLYIDGRREANGILGDPRLDIHARHPEAGDRSLRSGFRCEFDYSALSPGLHRFEFRARTTTEEATLTRMVRRRDDGAPLLVTDVFVDIVGTCNLSCAMCPHGNLERLEAERSVGFMPPELFERILAHLRDTGFLEEYVNLYNWGEPLLHPQLGGFLDACRRYDLKVILSSNLSVARRRLEPILRQPVELLMVSISGFTQETYSRNHRGGRLRRVIENLETLAWERSTIGTVLLKYLVFDHNGHEIELARRFAADHGFEFGAYTGAVPSVESDSLIQVGDDYAITSRRYTSLSGASRRATRSCPQETKIVIDHRGRLEHCTMAWNRVSHRSVFEVDLRAYLMGKLDNDACQRCLASGYSDYRHYGVIAPELLHLSSAAVGHGAGPRAGRRRPKSRSRRP